METLRSHPNLLSQDLQFSEIPVNLHAHSSGRRQVLDQIVKYAEGCHPPTPVSVADINNLSQSFLPSSESSEVMLPGSIGQTVRVGPR